MRVIINALLVASLVMLSLFVFSAADGRDTFPEWDSPLPPASEYPHPLNELPWID